MFSEKGIFRHIAMPVGFGAAVLFALMTALAPASRADEDSSGAGSIDVMPGEGQGFSGPEEPRPMFDHMFMDDMMTPPQEMAASDEQQRTISRLESQHIYFLTAQNLRDKTQSDWHGVIVDVGAKSSYLASHITGAINIPENRISDLAQVILPDKTTPIVVYCGSTQCMASEGAARTLKNLGYADVYEFWGGLKDWTAMGFPTKGSEVASK